MDTPDFAAVDADNHYYEPEDAFTRHIEARFADRTVRVVDDGGDRMALVDDRPYYFLDHAFSSHPPVPGSLKQQWRQVARGEEVGEDESDGAHPAFSQRQPRLQLMDEHGLESCFMLPTVGVSVLNLLWHDLELADASYRAFNRWVEEEWGFGADGRIYGAPVIALLDPADAAAEAKRVADLGARLVVVHPGPAGAPGQRCSPADPRFDGFWTTIADAGITVILHIAESGYNELYSTDWSEEPNPPSGRFSALQWTLFNGYRPVMDTLGALVLHNLFGRHPGLRVISIENGSLWVPFLLASMDKMRVLGRNGRWVGGAVTERPSDVFRRHVWITPYPEEDPISLIRTIGADRVVFGSDFPHPEGLAEPLTYAASLTALDDEDVRLVMRENALSLVGGG